MHARTVQYLSIAFFATLLVWGLYTLFFYLGMPIHQAVLLTDVARADIAKVCGEPGPQAVWATLCSGGAAVLPFLLHTIGRAAPFMWYVLISILLYGGFVFFRYIRDGDWTLRITWKPWKIFVLFLACTWLLFTTLSYGSDPSGRPIRTMIEPTTESYNVSAEGLDTLQQDYQRLVDRGCIAPQGQTNGGTNIGILRTHCIQWSFIMRVVPQILFLLGLVLELLIAGSMLLAALKYRPARPLTEFVLSIGLGAFLWVAMLWLLAVLGVYTPVAGWGLAVLIPVVGYRYALTWLRRFRDTAWEGEYAWHAVAMLLGWLLLSYIAINFLTVVRPFPIGWDDLGSYLNRPRLLVSYGHFIHSMSPFDWSYLTSLGFLLFGYDSIFGATASMMVNWLAGPLAALAVYAFARLFLGQRAGLLSALLYYSLPLVGHFSFADMKIDNAVFFVGVLAMLSVFLALFPETQRDAESAPAPAKSADDSAAVSVDGSRSPWQLFVLGGIFCGFAFAIKATAVMVLMPVVGILLAVTLHWSAFVAICFFASIFFTQFGGVSLSLVLSRITSSQVTGDTGMLTFLILFSLIGCAFLGYALYRGRVNGKLVAAIRRIAFFIAGLLISIGPWMLHNNIAAGNVIPKFLLGAPNNFSPSFAIRGETLEDHGQPIRAIPPELALNPDHPACQSTGVTEELDRYWGFGNGWGHYLTLPWRSVMNVDAVGYYVTTMPAVLLFPLVLLLPYFWTRRGRWLRWLAIGTGFMIMEWVVLANGVPWYGIGMFLGLVIALEAMIVRAPDALSRWVGTILLALALCSNFAMRFWQFEQQQNILEYSFGKVSASSLEELTIPHYNDIRDIVTERHAQYPDRPYLYRVGTFIPYFIPKNLERIGINDHQLDVFNCLYQERDGALTIQRLKSLGFNSIVFDTNTATIEADPAGSLHRKVNAFVEFVNTPSLGLQVYINDPKAGVAFIAIP